MSIPEQDEIIINLKILSKVDKNRKLITKQNFLNLESDTFWFEGLKRWYNGDSREETLKKLDNLITKAIEKSKNFSEIKKYLFECIIGLENLKETYSKCTQTNARLDVIIEKINNFLGLKKKTTDNNELLQ